MNKNTTRYKTLDKAAQHPAVQLIEEDSDGIWVHLNAGWNWENCTAIHEYTVRKVMAELRNVKPFSEQP